MSNSDVVASFAKNFAKRKILSIIITYNKFQIDYDSFNWILMFFFATEIIDNNDNIIDCMVLFRNNHELK